MTMQELPLLSIREAGDLIRKREVSPVELVEATLERIALHSPTLNDYITVTADQARRDAKRAEREIASGRYRGPLHGLPVGVKDLFATKGTRTTMGSKIMADWVPDYDATTVAKLQQAGAIIVGKHNCSEFAFGSTNVNAHYGPVRNPWNPERVSGGSSGGTAASVSAGTCIGGLGTDTGGSIRKPSCLCGGVGLKPTAGRVSRFGVTPLSWTMDHVGPMTRTVWDCAAMLGVVAGYDHKDPSSARVPVPDYTAELDASTEGLKGLRVGALPAFFWDAASEEVSSLARRALGVLKDLEAEVVEVSLPSVHLSNQVGDVIYLSEAAAWHEGWLRTRPLDYSSEVLVRLHAGAMFSAVQYHKAQRMRSVIRQETLKVLERVDVLVSPTSHEEAPKVEESMPGASKRSSPLLHLGRLTRTFNISGVPALSVPCGFTGSGLPVGLQIAGRNFDEAGIFRVAHLYERATEWHKLRPQLSG